MATQRYEVFIRSTKSAVWDAITRPEHTTRYFFGTSVESTFQPGARVAWVDRAAGEPKVEGQVLEVDSQRRLAHTFTSVYDPALAKETSRVTWLVEGRGEAVKLTVEHVLDAAPLTAEHVGHEGWATVLSSLKTLLETGTPLVLPRENE